MLNDKPKLTITEWNCVGQGGNTFLYTLTPLLIEIKKNLLAPNKERHNNKFSTPQAEACPWAKQHEFYQHLTQYATLKWQCSTFREGEPLENKGAKLCPASSH